MIKRFQHVLLVLVFLQYFTAEAQVRFEAYSPLQSRGKMPEIFRTSTQDKIDESLKEDRPSMSEKEELIFLENVHYNVDELLHSGLVLYGDPATKYVQNVATTLLNGAPRLKKKLQFYVLKSNVTNALSTEQGIIFVTLGLLAQLENEAQLAYVISHEIAHFQEDHVEKSYEERIKIDHRASYDSRISLLSNHSKEKELEADKIGIELYHKAGYAKSELLSAFDVLMYSYLPFDEVPLPKSYFNNENLFVPDIYFPETINPILAEEEYDDSKSSHPNIRRRKDAIESAMANYSNWGKKKFLLEEAAFEEVREVARFESVRLSLAACDYGEALYNIFLLEKKYPNNLFLSRCKGQAWLGMAAFKVKGSFTKTVTKPSKVEGESHAMHYFLRELSKQQLLTLAIRQVEDVRKRFPEDAEINAIYEQTVAVLAGYSRYKLSDYRKINYETALERFERSKEALKQDTLATDTLNTVEQDESLSKYDKIKKKRNAEEAVSEEDEFDVEQFHLYAISDLLDDENFKKAFREKRKEIEDLETEEEERLRNMSFRERELYFRNRGALSESGEIILVEPAFYSFYYDDDRPKNSAIATDIISSSIKKYCERFEINVYDITLNDLEKENTEKYNERVLLMNYLRQRMAHEEGAMFPVDYSYLDEMRADYGDAKLLFALGSHTKTRVTSRANLSFILIDLDSGELTELNTARFRKPKKMVIDGFVYDVLSRLKRKR